MELSDPDVTKIGWALRKAALQIFPSWAFSICVTKRFLSKLHTMSKPAASAAAKVFSPSSQQKMSRQNSKKSKETCQTGAKRQGCDDSSWVLELHDNFIKL